MTDYERAVSAELASREASAILAKNLEEVEEDNRSLKQRLESLQETKQSIKVCQLHCLHLPVQLGFSTQVEVLQDEHVKLVFDSVSVL